MDRRGALGLIGGAGIALAGGFTSFAMAQTRAFGGSDFAEALRAAERRAGGRLGVAVLDLATGARASQRGDERFALCSTFKFLLAAAVLDAAEAGRVRLGATLPVTRADIIANSPTSERHVGGAIAVVAACEATMIYSDNTAANLLLPLIGGPAGLTRFLRSLGDRVSRLDREEPDMSEARPGDPRDTTSPAAMLETMRALLFGNRLTPASRRRLTGWLVANTTGATRLRAGLPAHWRVGDKTGTGGYGSVNDIGVLWPAAGRRPILVTSYLTGSTADDGIRYGVHADVARAIAAAIA